MKKLKGFCILLVILSVLSPVSLYSLSDEEAGKLPELSKAELIQIILIYDQTLTEIENDLTNRKQLLTERESLIRQMETLLSEQKDSLQEREKLLVTSLELQAEIKKKEATEDILLGIGCLLGGGLIGALLFAILD